MMALREIDLPPSDATDLAALWKKAVDDYAKTTKADLSQMRMTRNIGDIMNSASEQKDNFSMFRNKGDKSGKMREILGKHLGGMQKCMDGIAMVGSAAAVFPPAMPVTLVFSACSRVLGAFAGVKADFDQIEDFLSLSGRFFERLSIIESTNCSDGPLGTAIVRVFSAQLSVYAIVHEMMNRKRVHIKKFFEALWDSRDPALTTAFATMQAAIDELARTVGFASYAAIKSTQDVTVHINEKTEKLDEAIREWREQQSEDIFKIFEQSLNIETAIHDMHRAMTISFESWGSNLESLRTAQDKANAQIIKAMERGQTQSKDQDMDKRKRTTLSTGKGEIGDKRLKAIRSIKSHFNDNDEDFRNWTDAQKENTAQYNDIQEAFVDGTGDWLIKNTTFQQWVDGEKRLLWLKGADGIGKSFLSFAGIRNLLSQSEKNAVAYFYFKEDYPYLQSVQNAVACTALQIAEKNASYAKHIAKALKDDKDAGTAMTSWQRFFLSIFHTSSDASSTDFTDVDKLYLIFDGLDEMPAEQLQVFMQFLADLKSRESRVHVLVSSRPQQISLEQYEPLTIDVSKSKILHDIKTFVWDRLNSGEFGRLKKFSLAAKKIIRRKIAKQADGMLYVDHMIRRLSYIGREGAVLRDLENMPKDLHELYKCMLDDCRKNRSEEQYEAMKQLFAWLAFSKRPLSLAEASELVTFTLAHDDLDIEDEIIGRSARILELSRLSRLGEDHDDNKDDDNEDQDDEDVTNLDEYRTAPLTFQERSLGQYFRALSVEQHGTEELRTPASVAQLTILKMCIDVLIKSASCVDRKSAPELRNYAAKYWYEHFNELDIENTTDNEVAQVLVCLHSILTNQDDVSKIFDEQATTSQLYPERKADDPEPWYDRVQPWLAKASSLPTSMIAENIKTWASTLSDNPKDVLAPLARGHLNNWFAGLETTSIIDCYASAEATLKICGKLEGVPQDPLDKILFVSNSCGEIHNDPQHMRAIGTRAYYDGMDNITDARQKEIKTTAISYLADSATMTPNNSLERVATLLILSDMQASMEETQKSIDSLDEAIAAFAASKDTRSAQPSQSIDTEMWEIYWLKGLRLNNLKERTKSLQSLEEARKYFPETTKGKYAGGRIFDTIVIIWDEMRDEAGLMEAMKSWNDKERLCWLDYNLQSWRDMEAIQRMYRAAKTTGETDIVLEWLQKHRKTLPPHSLAAFNAESALADFYDKVLGDVDKAKDALRSTLQVQPKVAPGAWEEYTMHEQVSGARQDLAGIIFAQFLASDEPTRKEQLMDEMKTIPGTRGGDFRESHIGMLMANMLRIMGPTREYQTYMNQIFDTCIAGLEDSDIWNDNSSLRLLAKLLSSLEGLERDARIAISAQFSVLDKSIYDTALMIKSSSDDEHVGTASNAEGSDNETTKTTAEGESPKDLNRTDSTRNSIEGTGDSTADVSNIPGQKDEAKAENIANDETATIKPVNSTQVEAKETQAAEPSLPEEDLACWPIFCNGDCDTSISKWSEPLYLCLICPDTDLCATCHAKRLDSETGEGHNSWKHFCAPNHCYIKGAMKGWQGIKDGIIRIDGEDPLAVTDWIKGLKEERWPKAWKRYWLKQGGLKNIDVA
ncbi:hypothetical protein GQ44DRAFT_759148 [Phaeosphaeriaceae sp. PMI808]|nr:hypothetical protein GQ44DRAFT_759148 [Phaeosphaeriaceae sp. PMI808]